MFIVLSSLVGCPPDELEHEPEPSGTMIVKFQLSVNDAALSVLDFPNFVEISSTTDGIRIR